MYRAGERDVYVGKGKGKVAVGALCCGSWDLLRWGVGKREGGKGSTWIVVFVSGLGKMYLNCLFVETPKPHCGLLLSLSLIFSLSLVFSLVYIIYVGRIVYRTG